MRSVSRRSRLHHRAAVVRSPAVSTISLKRRRTRSNSFSFVIFSNRPSNACRSSGVKLSGSRRKAHICERNAFRSALLNFALYSRVIFSKCIDGLVELLGHMEPVDHGTAVLQPLGARCRIGRAHVHSVGPHLLALL